MNQLAAYFQSAGADTYRVFGELNNQLKPDDGSLPTILPQDIASNGGMLTCVEEKKVVVDINPQILGQDGTFLLSTIDNKPFLTTLINNFKKNPNNENVVTYAMVETETPNPADNSKTLSKKYVVVAKGRHALLGEKLDKNHHRKFVCYIAYPVK